MFSLIIIGLSSKLLIIYSTTILMAKGQKARQSCFEVEQWKYVVLTQPRDMRDVLFNINGTVILLDVLLNHSERPRSDPQSLLAID